MLQRFVGSFATDSLDNLFNLVDVAQAPLSGGVGNPFASQWSSGAIHIEPCPLQPNISNKWKILSFSVTAQMQLGTGPQWANVGDNFGYGKLGKLFAGIYPPGQNVHQTTSVQGGNTNPWINGNAPLPNDNSLIVPLWTPESDPLPPAYLNPGSPPSLPIVQSLQLPQPLAFTPGESLYLGMWLTPTLVGTLTSGGSAIVPIIFNTTYSIIYDDGRQ